MEQVTSTEVGNGSATTPTEEQVIDTSKSVEADKSNAATTKPADADQSSKATVNYEAKFKELQRAYTQETQRRSAVEKQWNGVSSKLEEQAKILAEMRKQPYDREKFLAEFQDKGPDVLRPIWTEDISAVEQKYSKQLGDQANELRQVRTEMAVERRRNDVANYPDFKKLEPTIAEMLDDPNCPVDFSKPISEVIDVLYSLARQASSVEAIQAAEAAGASTAMTKLVKESKTTVTGGGKAASTTKPDLNNMSTADLRKYFVGLNGEVNRD